MDDDPLGAGDHGDLLPLPEGGAPVSVVQLVGRLAALIPKDLLRVEDPAPKLRKLKELEKETVRNNYSS